MPGPNRRSKRLKQTTELTDISQFSSVNPTDGDVLIFDATDGVYENGKAFTGDYTFTGTQSITGSLSVSNDITITDSLTVSGNTNLDAALAVTGAASLNSSLAVGTTLSVTGAVSLSDTLSVSGATSVAGFSVSGAAQFDGNVNIDGTATINALTLVDLSLSGSLTAVNATLSGDVGITGTLTAGALSAGTVSGTSVVGTTVSGGTVAAGDMGITSNAIDIAGTSGTLSFTMDDSTDTEQTVLLLDPDGEQDFSGTVEGIILPTGTNAQRASTPVEGTIRYDSTDSEVQVYQGAAWVAVGSGSGGGGIAAVVDDTTPQLGGMLDVNGQAIGDGTRELLTFVEDASAVNHVEIENQATGSGPIIRAAGDDANVTLNIAAKGTGNIAIGNFTLDADQAVGAGQDNYVLTYDNGTGLISLEAGATTLTNFQDNGVVGEMLYSTDVVIRTTSSGLSVHDTSGGVEQPILTLRDRADTTTYGGFGYLPSNNGVWLYSQVVSGELNLLGYNASSSFVNLAVFDPDGSSKLYYNNLKTAQTQSDGLDTLHGSSASFSGVLRFKNNAGTLMGLINVDSSDRLNIVNDQDGGNVRLRADNASGTEQTLANGDPDGAFTLNYAGGLRWSTTDSGVQVNGLISIGSRTTRTISAGAITAVSGYHRVDTEASAATDDLDTITFAGTTGSILVISANASSRTVVAKDSTGNMDLAGDFSMTHSADTLTLIWNGTTWHEISRSDNAA